LIVRFYSQAHEIINQEGVRVYTVLQNNRDSPLPADRQHADFYTFLAGDSDDLDQFTLPKSYRCRFADGYAVLGMRTRVKVTDRLDVTTKALGAGDAMLANLCKGLGQRVGASSRDSAVGSYAINNFEALTDGDGGPLAIQFMPGELTGEPFETRAARDYWLGAVASFDPASAGAETIRALKEEQGPSAMVALERQAAETDSINMSIGLRTLGMSATVEGQRHDALRAYGKPFEDLERQWEIYLRTATVRIDGANRPLVRNGAYQTFLPRFRADELGGARFWAHIGDTSAYSAGVNCLATMFAVESQYARPADVRPYAGCVAAKIRSARSG
jgi:hypothetical protein